MANCHCEYYLPIVVNVSVTDRTQADGQVISPWNAPGFEIDVSWAKVTPPTPDSFPRLQDGGFKRLMHATNGKAGGWSGAE
jgi:hypothetical protein